VRRIGLAAIFAAAILCGRAARAGGLSPPETDRLLHGDTVTRPQTLARGDHRYVGGVTYTVVDAGLDELAGLFDDVRSWRRFLPKTRDAQRVGSAGGDALVEITHGSALVKVAYTMRVHRDGNIVRFWLDFSRPHDIEDAWGFFRVEPMPTGQSLMTYGILIDMGAGLLRDMFEGRVQQLALEVPDNVRGVLVQRSARGRSASLAP
jgi:hypothetical protein